MAGFPIIEDIQELGRWLKGNLLCYMNMRAEVGYSLPTYMLSGGFSGPCVFPVLRKGRQNSGNMLISNARWNSSRIVWVSLTQWIRWRVVEEGTWHQPQASPACADTYSHIHSNMYLQSIIEGGQGNVAARLPIGQAGGNCKWIRALLIRMPWRTVAIVLGVCRAGKLLR